MGVECTIIQRVFPYYCACFFLPSTITDRTDYERDDAGHNGQESSNNDHKYSADPSPNLISYLATLIGSSRNPIEWDTSGACIEIGMSFSVASAFNGSATSTAI